MLSLIKPRRINQENPKAIIFFLLNKFILYLLTVTTRATYSTALGFYDFLYLYDNKLSAAITLSFIY